MIDEERDYVMGVIDNEGFGYTFMHYSDFSNIKDEEFHRLRRAFVAAADNLKDYLEYEC